MLFNFCLHFPPVFIIKTVDNQFRYCNLILFERTKDFCKTIFARATTTFSMLTVRYIVSILLIPVILKCFTAVKFSNCSNHKVLLRAFLSLAAWFENYPNKCGNLLQITQILILNLIIVDLINWNLLKNTLTNQPNKLNFNHWN